MRPESQFIHLLHSLVVDPVFDHVRGENSTLEQVVVVGL